MHSGKKGFRMTKITFPDGTAMEYQEGINSLQIAEQISPRLAKEVYSATVNGELWDLSRPIVADATLRLHKWDDDEAKHAFWHSSAHLMAEALESLYPGMKFGIGPAIENGFYYDVDPGDRVINCVPTFGMYQFSTDAWGGKVITVPRNANFGVDIAEVKKAAGKGTKVIFVASPNNPSGNVTPEEDILRLLELPAIVVLDEAYYEFSQKTLAPLVQDHDNLIVLRTFSKWAGLAGLRKPGPNDENQL